MLHWPSPQITQLLAQLTRRHEEERIQGVYLLPRDFRWPLRPRLIMVVVVAPNVGPGHYSFPPLTPTWPGERDAGRMSRGTGQECTQTRRGTAGRPPRPLGRQVAAGAAHLSATLTTPWLLAARPLLAFTRSLLPQPPRSPQPPSVSPWPMASRAGLSITQRTPLALPHDLRSCFT